MLHYILFFLFAAIALGGALNLLFQRHPINSALSLILVMMSLAVLYLLLGAEFVAAVQILVYAGAIMVLFVFVIMLLNAGEEERSRTSRVAYLAGVPGALAVLGLLLYSVFAHNSNFGSVQLGTYLVSTGALGGLLFRDFLLPFEITSVLILIAIMGAVVLGRRDS